MPAQSLELSSMWVLSGRAILAQEFLAFRGAGSVSVP